MREKFSARLELQVNDTKRNTFTGIASVPGSLVAAQPPANIHTFFMPGAWGRTLRERASKIAIYGGESHGKGGHSVMIGHLLNGSEINGGRLQVTGHISNTSIGKDDLELMRDGSLKELSVGWVPISAERVSGRDLIERLSKMSLPRETAEKMRHYISEVGEHEKFRLVNEAMLDHVAIVREGADTETQILEVNEADKEPYGDVAYADPGFQEDKKKRYPIDTEAHIRAAWNYISKPKNAGAYSTSQVSKIKARIIAAWKKKIDAEGPPSAQENDAMPEDKKLEKQSADPDALFLSMRPLVTRITEILDLEQSEAEPEAGSPEEAADMAEDYSRLDEIRQLAAGLTFLANSCYPPVSTQMYSKINVNTEDAKQYVDAILKDLKIEKHAGRMLSAANEKKLQAHADNLHAHGDAAHSMAADLQAMINSMYKESTADETSQESDSAAQSKLAETTPAPKQEPEVDAAVLIERENIKREAMVREAMLRHAKLTQELFQ